MFDKGYLSLTEKMKIKEYFFSHVFTKINLNKSDRVSMTNLYLCDIYKYSSFILKLV